MSHSGVAGATSFSVVVRGAVDFAGSCGATQQLQPCWATGRVMAANAWQQLACSASGEAWQQPESQQQVAAWLPSVGSVAVGSVEFATQQAASPLHAQAISTAGRNPVCNASSPKTSQRSEDGG